MASRQARMSVARLEAMWQIVETEAKACVDALVQVSARLAALQTTKASSLLAKYASQRETLTAQLVKQFESNSMALHRCLDKYGAVARQMVRAFDSIDPLQVFESIPVSEDGPKLVRSFESSEYSQSMPSAVRSNEMPHVHTSIPAAGIHPKLLRDALRDTLAMQETQDAVRAYSCEHWRRVQLLQTMSDSRDAGEIKSLASAWSADSEHSYLKRITISSKVVDVSESQSKFRGVSNTTPLLDSTKTKAGGYAETN